MILKEIKQQIPMAHGQRPELTITDEGNSYDHNRLTKPTAGENLTGCGVFVVKHPAGQCVSNTKGNKVERPFKL